MATVDPKQPTGTKCALTDAGQASTLARRAINMTCAGQLKRSASAYGANYLAACRTHTESDFIDKLSRMAADWSETVQVLDLLAGQNPGYAEKINGIRREGDELFSAIGNSLDLLH